MELQKVSGPRATGSLPVGLYGDTRLGFNVTAEGVREKLKARLMEQVEESGLTFERKKSSENQSFQLGVARISQRILVNCTL